MRLEYINKEKEKVSILIDTFKKFKLKKDSLLLDFHTKYKGHSYDWTLKLSIDRILNFNDVIIFLNTKK